MANQETWINSSTAPAAKNQVIVFIAIKQEVSEYSATITHRVSGV
jgi:hypothetical protein